MTQEVEAESDGVLLKIVIADGEVDVGTTVGIIGAQDEDVSGSWPGRRAEAAGARGRRAGGGTAGGGAGRTECPGHWEAGSRARAGACSGRGGRNRTFARRAST